MQDLESPLRAKDQTIIMRVKGEVKRRIEAAAKARGLTVTTFVTEAATAAALAEQAPPKYEAGECFEAPAKFVQACREAQRGGAFGYERTGLILAVGALAAIKRDHAKWNKDLKDLRKAFAAKDDPAVLEWFDVHYVHAMQEIPQRRRNQFLCGVYAALKSGTWGGGE